MINVGPEGSCVNSKAVYSATRENAFLHERRELTQGQADNVSRDRAMWPDDALDYYRAAPGQAQSSSVLGIWVVGGTREACWRTAGGASRHLGP